MIKRNFKRLVLSLIISFTAFSAIPAFPSIAKIPIEVEAAVEPTIEPRADVIYWVYRALADGTIQKRRWNETRGCWMDPHWITVT